MTNKEIKEQLIAKLKDADYLDSLDLFELLSLAEQIKD